MMCGFDMDGFGVWVWCVGLVWMGLVCWFGAWVWCGCVWAEFKSALKKV